MKSKYPPSIIEEVNSLTLDVIKLQQDMEEIKRTINEIIEVIDKSRKEIKRWEQVFKGGE